jgi:hypothetical protein
MTGEWPKYRRRECNDRRDAGGEPDVSRLAVGRELDVAVKSQQFPERCDRVHIGRVCHGERA